MGVDVYPTILWDLVLISNDTHCYRYIVTDSLVINILFFLSAAHFYSRLSFYFFGYHFPPLCHHLFPLHFPFPCYFSPSDVQMNSLDINFPVYISVTGSNLHGGCTRYVNLLRLYGTALLQLLCEGCLWFIIWNIAQLHTLQHTE